MLTKIIELANDYTQQHFVGFVRNSMINGYRIQLQIQETVLFVTHYNISCSIL